MFLLFLSVSLLVFLSVSLSLCFSTGHHDAALAAWNTHHHFWRLFVFGLAWSELLNLKSESVLFNSVEEQSLSL